MSMWVEGGRGRGYNRWMIVEVTKIEGKRDAFDEFSN